MDTLPPLTPETIWDILNDKLDDGMVNALAWHHLGYRYDEITGRWHPEATAAPWKEKYPEPPNFIESRPATVQLTRTIPADHKQLLKTYLGFKGYRVDQLIPRLTRRATIANFLLSVMRDRGDI